MSASHRPSGGLFVRFPSPLRRLHHQPQRGHSYNHGYAEQPLKQLRGRRPETPEVDAEAGRLTPRGLRRDPGLVRSLITLTGRNGGRGVPRHRRPGNSDCIQCSIGAAVSPSETFGVPAQAMPTARTRRAKHLWHSRVRRHRRARRAQLPRAPCPHNPSREGAAAHALISRAHALVTLLSRVHP
eukprot:SAG11_NODE_4328_length_1946_cov_2.121819_2_plen_184_part_00